MLWYSNIQLYIIYKHTHNVLYDDADKVRIAHLFATLGTYEIRKRIITLLYLTYSSVVFTILNSENACTLWIPISVSIITLHKATICTSDLQRTSSWLLLSVVLPCPKRMWLLYGPQWPHLPDMTSIVFLNQTSASYLAWPCACSAISCKYKVVFR